MVGDHTRPNVDGTFHLGDDRAFAVGLVTPALGGGYLLWLLVRRDS